MTWFRLDDGSDFHEKIVQAGNEAWGAVCRAGAWSSKYGTNGNVPKHIAELIAPEKVWKRAENARGSRGEHGLVERCEGGWQLHDFCDWNPSAEEVEKQRLELHEKRKRAGLAGSEKRWGGQRRIASAIASAIANPKQKYDSCQGRDLAPDPILSIPDPDPDPDPDLHAPACSPIAKVGRPPKQAKPKQTEPGFAIVRDCWFETFERSRGVKPAFDARDGKAIKTLLAKLGEARSCDAIRNAFTDSWWAANRASLPDIANNPNPHLGAKPRINGRQQVLQPSAGKDWGEKAKSPTDAEWEEFQAKGLF